MVQTLYLGRHRSLWYPHRQAEDTTITLPLGRTALYTGATGARDDHFVGRAVPVTLPVTDHSQHQKIHEMTTLFRGLNTAVQWYCDWTLCELTFR